jgi:copper chaperone CopZ
MEELMSNSINHAGASCCELGAAKRGKAGTLGALSAVLASACCGVPLALISLGLGGLGLGSFLGTYHWHFTAAGALLLGAAWFVFFREKAKLASAGAEIRNSRLTPALLAVATAAVLGFGGLSVASALGLSTKARDVGQASSGSSGELAQVVLPVEGMTCVTCEWGIEKALGGLEGVAEAKASASESKVLVRYEPGKVTLERMIEAVDSTGYKASMPDASEPPGGESGGHE